MHQDVVPRRVWQTLLALTGGLLALVTWLLLTPPIPVAAANTLHVTNCTDTGVSGDGSLRGEIAAASAFDTIVFDLDCTGGSSITVGSTLGLSQSLQIDGTGHTVVLDGGCTFSNGVCQSVGVLVIGVNFGVRVSLSNLTVQHGASVEGGGIASNGTLTVTNSTITGNSAIGAGGGIQNNSGQLTVTNSTITGNRAFGGGGGGGINISGGALTVTNSTITGNSANTGGGINISSTPFPLYVINNTITGNSAGNGGGIENESAMLDLTNTIASGNTSTSGGADFDGIFPALISHNLIGGNPVLGPLGNNGGPTPTIPLLAGSPAIAHGDADICASTAGPAPVGGKDQRGYLRQASVCSIGAYEAQPEIPTPLPGGKPPGPAGGLPTALPVTRPAGPASGTTPNPLPVPRP